MMTKKKTRALFVYGNERGGTFRKSCRELSSNPVWSLIVTACVVLYSLALVICLTSAQCL